MSNSLSDIILSYWGQSTKLKQTPSGWYSGNCPCCHHRGETKDTRGRGGLKFQSDGALVYNCFNCKFHVSWAPGRMISDIMRSFLKWLGVPENEIKQIAFRTWLEKETVLPSGQSRVWWPNFASRELPIGAKSFSWWAEHEPNNKNFNDVLSYLLQRDKNLLHKYDYYFSDAPKNKDPKKDNPAFRSVIIPFYYEDRIVGWSARKIDKSKYRYMSEVQQNYLFNCNILTKKREFVLIVEGVFDAINLDCIGTLGSKLSMEQIDWLNRIEKPKIIVPDRDKAGLNLLNIAKREGWAVSVPTTSGPNKVWESDIKDVSQAVSRYGLLYVMETIKDAATSDPLEIEMKKYYIND